MFSLPCGHTAEIVEKQHNMVVFDLWSAPNTVERITGTNEQSNTYTTFHCAECSRQIHKTKFTPESIKRFMADNFVSEDTQPETETAEIIRDVRG